MYITKMIERYGTMEMSMADIDKESNDMYEKGYELVTYCYHPIANYIIMTFKKIK